MRTALYKCNGRQSSSSILLPKLNDTIRYETKYDRTRNRTRSILTWFCRGIVIALTMNLTSYFVTTFFVNVINVWNRSVSPSVCTALMDVKIFDYQSKVELDELQITMNDDGLFFEYVTNTSRNGIGEIREGFDLYRGRGIQIAEVYAWRKFVVGEFLGIFGSRVEKYARDMATTGRCGQVIDVTGAHGGIETKVGQLKLKSETKEFFLFFFFLSWMCASSRFI